MNQISETKGIILQDFNRRIISIEAGEATACRVHSEQLKNHDDKLHEISKQLWWLIITCFVTLVSVAFNVAISLAKTGIIK